MKLTLPIAFLTLYANGAFGLWFSAYPDSNSCSGDWVYGAPPPQCICQNTNKGIAARSVELWSNHFGSDGSTNGMHCALWASPDCHGDPSLFLDSDHDGYNYNCQTNLNPILSLKCTQMVDGQGDLETCEGVS